MDTLTKQSHLDLQLTPYRVLATSVTDGLVEYVPYSQTLAKILTDYDNKITNFFQHHHQSSLLYDRALQHFIRSSAGYCVITYILGIGDRHLDNILLTASGHLFHIDFSFLFGREPPWKPSPTPIRITMEMVTAMGGLHSIYYSQFKALCIQCYNCLRTHAALILNVLSLMIDANIPDLCTESNKHLLFVQTRFHLSLNDTEAGLYFVSLIDNSVNAILPIMMEQLHSISTLLR